MAKFELYLGDCLEYMKTLPDGAVDAVVTDPPYDEKTHSGARYGFRETSSVIPFMPLVDLSFVTECLRISRGWVVVFCALEMYGDYKRLAGDSWVRAGFWRRVNGVPQFTGDRPGQPGEGIAIMHSGKRRKAWNGNGRHGFWEFPIVQHDRCHPTQKPVNLMTSLVRDFTNGGDTVFDPFAGSGTTGVACMQTGRNFIGCEIDPGYFKIAQKRIEDAAAQLHLFEPEHAEPR